MLMAWLSTINVSIEDTFKKMFLPNNTSYFPSKGQLQSPFNKTMLDVGGLLQGGKSQRRGNQNLTRNNLIIINSKLPSTCIKEV